MIKQPLSEKANDYTDEGDLSVYEELREMLGDIEVDYFVVFNDESKKDFAWIADYIEKELLTDG